MHSPPTGASDGRAGLSLVVPCFNEAQSVERTVEELKRIASGIGAPHELLFIDDGSSDGTGEILDRLAEAEPGLRVVHHETNRGYGATLKTGIRETRHELIAITDADGTYPNDRLGDLLELAQDADMVVGARTGQNVTYSTLRSIPKALLVNWASWLVGQRIPDMNSGLRVFRRSAAERYLGILPDGFSFTTTITISMMRGPYRVVFEPIDYAKRTGSSKIKPVRDTLRFVQLITRTGMCFAPLRLLAPLVGLLLLAAMASLVYDVVALANLTDKTVLLLLFAMNTAMFALLADMIHRRVAP